MERWKEDSRNSRRSTFKTGSLLNEKRAQSCHPHKTPQFRKLALDFWWEQNRVLLFIFSGTLILFLRLFSSGLVECVVGWGGRVMVKVYFKAKHLQLINIRLEKSEKHPINVLFIDSTRISKRKRMRSCRQRFNLMGKINARNCNLPPLIGTPPKNNAQTFMIVCVNCKWTKKCLLVVIEIDKWTWRANFA